MRRLLSLLVILAACHQAPATTPQPTQVPVFAGDPPAPPPRFQHHERSDPAKLAVQIERERVVLAADGIVRAYPDVGGAIDGVGLLGAFDALGSVEEADVVIADDASYQRLITGMDWLMHATTNVALRAPGELAVQTRPGASTDPKTTPIVIVSPTDLLLGKTRLASLSEVAGDQVIPQLGAALDAAPPSALAVLQAEKTTPGATVNAVVMTLDHHGIGQILFAVKR